MAELIPFFYRIERSFQVLVKGKKPPSIPTGKILSLKEWRAFVRKSKSEERRNPIKEAYKYLKFLEENPGTTFKDVAEEFNISKARVSQMIALVEKLPSEIFDYVAENDKVGYFTERKLRPLTLVESDNAKIELFRERKANIS